MPQIDLWRQSPAELARYQVRQIVAIAGDGRLRDDSDCSAELRAYLRETPSQQLCDYVAQCLDASFDNSGFVLQDSINEIGRRLEFAVDDGLYQGRQGKVGYDGIWRSPGTRDLIIEVKTTDQYNVKLETIARYKSELVAQGRVAQESSILFVVGRQDTGALEAQIRGSKYAWDMRVISAASLVKLLQIKEKSAADQTIAKIRELLQPFEYTRLDKIVDVIFDTASDVEQQTDIEREAQHPVGQQEGAESEPEARQQARTDPTLMNALKERILTTLSEQLGARLVKRRPALFETVDGNKRVCISISKRYDQKHQNYWYAYHPAWDQFLEGAPHATHVLGCMDRDEAFALPRQFLHAKLTYLNQTVREGGVHYWHIGLVENQNRSVSLILNNGERIDLSVYSMPLFSKRG